MDHYTVSASLGALQSLHLGMHIARLLVSETKTSLMTTGISMVALLRCTSTCLVSPYLVAYGSRVYAHFGVCGAEPIFECIFLSRLSVDGVFILRMVCRRCVYRQAVHCLPTGGTFEPCSWL